ncbi:hypothetical protein Tco_0408247 [Tanacetum coccineum]
MGTIDSMKSILTQSALDVLCEKFHIPDTVHPKLPGRNDRIQNSPTIKLVDASIFPLVFPWHTNKTLRNDPHPTPVEFNADLCEYLANNPAPFKKFSEPFLCLSRYYDLDENCYSTFWTDDDEGGCALFAFFDLLSCYSICLFSLYAKMDLFAFINHVDPTKVRIGERWAQPRDFEGLIHVLDEHNGLVRLFRTARDIYNADERPGFKIRLYSMGGVHGYELPTSDIIGGIVFEDGPRSRTNFDVIIEFRGEPPQRINKLNQSCMSLQFPGDHEGIVAGLKIMLLILSLEDLGICTLLYDVSAASASDMNFRIHIGFWKGWTKENLNVCGRSGSHSCPLVQERDSLKQQMAEKNDQIEDLKTELIHHEEKGMWDGLQNPIEKENWCATYLNECQVAKVKAEQELGDEKIQLELGDVKDEAGKLASKLTDVMTTMKSLEDATLVSEQHVAQLTKEKRELQALNTNTAEELRKAMEEVSTHAINLNEAHKTTKSLEDALSVSEQHVAQLNEEKRDFEIIQTKTEEELQKAKEEVSTNAINLSEAYKTIKSLATDIQCSHSVLLCITWLHLPAFKQLKTNVLLKDADAWLSEVTRPFHALHPRLLTSTTPLTQQYQTSNPTITKTCGLTTAENTRNSSRMDHQATKEDIIPRRINGRKETEKRVMGRLQTAPTS